jgi:hypothetical protein
LEYGWNSKSMTMKRLTLKTIGWTSAILGTVGTIGWLATRNKRAKSI